MNREVPEVDNPELQAFIRANASLTHILHSRVRFLDGTVGLGGQGCVKLGKVPLLGWCAVKEFIAVPSLVRGVNLDSMREAIQTFEMSLHPHTVRFFGFTYQPDSRSPKGLLLEPMMGGDLNKCLGRNSGKEISLNQKITFAVHIARAVAFLHSRGRIHRDIKPANVFVDQDLTVAKLGDFGFCKTAEPVNTHKKGTFHYMAPELLNPHTLIEYGYEVDVYSFGMTCYHIFTRRIPFEEEGVPNILNPAGFTLRILGRQDVPSRPVFLEEDAVPKEIQQLIQRCWQSEGNQRPRMVDVCQELEEFAERNNLEYI